MISGLSNLAQVGQLGGASTGGLYPAYRHYSILDERNEYAIGYVGSLYDSGTAKNDAVQPETAYRPSYVSGEYFQTNGSNGALILGAAPPKDTLIMLVNPTNRVATTYGQVFLGGYNSATGSRYGVGLSPNGTTLSVWFGIQSGAVLNSGVTPPDGWFLLTMQASAETGLVKLYLNGTLIYNVTATGNKSAGSCLIGGLFGSSGLYAACRYREVVQLPIIATDAQRIAWENHLKAKWGIS